MSNDWYENGELPPVNMECEVKIEGRWLPTVVIGHYDNEAVVVYPCITIQKFFSTTANSLRPLRTETDKLVEQAKAICKSWNDSRCKSIPELFIEANWRPIKPMSENEFVALICIGFDVNEDFCRELYQGGCRFIEKGE